MNNLPEAFVLTSPLLEVKSTLLIDSLTFGMICLRKIISSRFNLDFLKPHRKIIATYLIEMRNNIMT